MGTIARINDAMASVCKGQDKKSDAMMMMAPDSNWGQFLTPTPSTIALLGEMILITAETDFSLVSAEPKGGFKLVKYPNSFRSSLIQVSTAGWNAFNEAHTGMDHIRLITGNVHDHVKTAVQFLLKGTKKDVKTLVPKSLSAIRDIADESLARAKAIEDKFVEVMELTGELLEVCTKSKGDHDIKKKEIRIAIKIAKTERESMEEENGTMEKTLKEIDLQVATAHDELKEKMDKMPSTLGIIGATVAETFIDGVRTFFAFAKRLKGTVQGNEETRPFKDEDKLKDEANYLTERSQRRVYSQVSNINKSINQLVIIVAGETDDNNQPCPDMERIIQRDLDLIYAFIDMSRKHVMEEGENGVLQEKVLALCEETMKVCTMLKPLAENLAEVENNDLIREAVARVKRLQNESQILDIEAGKELGRNPLQNKSPYLSKMRAKNDSPALVKRVTENARYQTEVAKETLQDAKRRYSRCQDELRNTNKKLEKNLDAMKNIGLKKINFDTIRETLVNGIKSLAEVRKQWGKLVGFFQFMSNVINCCLNTSLKCFVELITDGMDSKEGAHAEPLSKAFRDAIFEQAIKADQIAHIVHTIAGAYVEISFEHLMDRLNSLGTLIGPESKDEVEIIRKRNELHNGCAEAQRAIHSIIMKQKEEFNRKVDDRIEEIMEIERSMPTIEPARIEEIQANVTSGMAAFTDEDVDDLI